MTQKTLAIILGWAIPFLIGGIYMFGWIRGFRSAERITMEHIKKFK